MKQLIIILIAAAVSAASLLAQPTLGDVTIPTPNRAVPYIIADTIGVVHGQAGLDVTWDYTGLRRASQLLQRVLDRSLLPSNIPLLFPGVQYGIVRDSVTVAFTRTPNTVRQLGVVTPNTLQVVTVDPYDTRPVEIVFNQRHLDRWNARITVFSPSLTTRRGGELDLVYEGFGTLRLPNREYPQVAMVTERIRTRDTSNVGSVVRVAVTTEVVTWWTETDKNIRLLEIRSSETVTTLNGNPAGPPTYSKSVMYYDQEAATSVDEGQAEVIYLSPLPADDEVMIHGLASGDAQVDVRDIVGRVVMSESVDVDASGAIRLGTATLANGVYMIDIVRRAEGVRSGRPVRATLVIRR
jgi:hypothetical protein